MAGESYVLLRPLEVLLAHPTDHHAKDVSQTLFRSRPPELLVDTLSLSYPRESVPPVPTSVPLTRVPKTSGQILETL